MRRIVRMLLEKHEARSTSSCRNAKPRSGQARLGCGKCSRHSLRTNRALTVDTSPSTYNVFEFGPKPSLFYHHGHRRKNQFGRQRFSSASSARFWPDEIQLRPPWPSALRRNEVGAHDNEGRATRNAYPDPTPTRRTADGCPAAPPRSSRIRRDSVKSAGLPSPLKWCNSNDRLQTSRPALIASARRRANVSTPPCRAGSMSRFRDRHPNATNNRGNDGTGKPAAGARSEIRLSVRRCATRRTRPGIARANDARRLELAPKMRQARHLTRTAPRGKTYPLAAGRCSITFRTPWPKCPRFPTLAMRSTIRASRCISCPRQVHGSRRL